MDESGLYYEWQGLGENWITTEESFDSDFPSQPYYDEDKTPKPVSTWVIEDVFDLPLKGNSAGIGSQLPGYDVKSRDAYEMIRLSLAAEMAGNNPKFYECYADENGKIEFYPIGEKNSNIGKDVLYSVDSGEIKLKCDNVIVMGYDPPPKKYSGNEYNLFTFAKEYDDILEKYSKTPSPDYDPHYEGPENFIEDPFLFNDPDRNQYPRYYVFGEILGPEACEYNIEGIIEYGDPMFNNVLAMSEIGVYNPDKFESVLGYIHKITVPFYEKGMTDVQFSATCPRYITISDEQDKEKGFGELLTRKEWLDNRDYTSQMCLQAKREFDIPLDVGIDLPDSEKRKFIGVKDIYIWGYKVKLSPCVSVQMIDGKPYIQTDSIAQFYAVLDTMKCEPFRLTNGDDYIIIKKKDIEGGEATENTEGYKAVFICNISPEWMKAFGGNFAAKKCYFRIHPLSITGREKDKDGNYTTKDMIWRWELDGTLYVKGYLRQAAVAGEDDEMVDNTTVYGEIVFPTGEGSTGIVVKKIVLVYNWGNPCVIIKDQRVDKISTEELKKVEIKFYPIIIKDDPFPTALNGKLLDPIEMRPDYDPATTQNLEETEYARALSSLESGDIKVTMPFAEPNDCIQISNMIKEIQTDVAHEIVYICEPDAEPVLGEKYGGGVINAIDYSYQDSSQYLISVHTGPLWRGVGSWDNSIYQMKTERVQLEGKVLQVSRDNVKCKVFINKIGLMECINGTNRKVEKGDFVSVTIYNNPVSL
ncbi:MAG: hypothetical protein ACTSQY_05425 [Candidatus Odinarchaeia archaeon]